MTKGIRAFALLGLLALTSWWLSGLYSLEQIQRAPQSLAKMDYYASQLDMTVSDENGQPKHRLVAETLSHIVEGDTTELKKPVVTVFNPSKPPWVIRSDTGMISPNGERIFFGGKVFIDRTGAKKLRPIKVVTKNLWVEPEKSFAETDERADIFRQSDMTRGVGLRVYFSDPMRLTLLSRVRGKYEVQ